MIKLHGDIGQVHTMAIAGQDKDASSPLFVRPELHQLYVTATEHLTRRCLRDGRPRCWWHIVGHGMWDRPLRALIERVVARTRDTISHEIALVGPGSNKRAAADLGVEPDRIFTSPLTAEQYLARYSNRVDDQPRWPHTMHDWLSSLG